MQPLHNTPTDRDTPKPRPSHWWRTMYPCKVNKGEHTYELIIPRFAQSKGKRDVHKYYAEQKERERRCYEQQASTGKILFCKTIYEFGCTACGHKYVTFLTDEPCKQE